MAKKKYKRDPRDLELTLATYTVIGQEVMIAAPLNLRGKIESFFRPEGHPQGTQYRIRLKKPLSFEEYAKKVNAATTIMNPEEFEDYLAEQGVPLHEEPRIERLPAPLYAKLHEHGLSQRDMLWYNLASTGCVEDQMVTCLWVPWDDARFDEVKRGMLVEFAVRFGLETRGRGEIRVVSGRVLGVKEGEGIIFLELFEPSPLILHPQIIRPEHLSEDMILDVAWFYGAGLYEALTEAFPDPELIPEGDWMEEGKIYRLKKPVPMEKIREYCGEHFSGPDADACAWQATTSYVLPIAAHAGTWHPLRTFEAEYFHGIVGVEMKEPWE